MNDDPLVEVMFTPELHEPVMIVALEGWIDAGMGAANAMSVLLGSAGTDPVAEFNADRLLDHRARRPVMHLVNGLITHMSWPEIDLRAGTDADLSNASLTRANLTGTNLTGADLTGVGSAEPGSGEPGWVGITGTPFGLPSNFQFVNGFLIGPGVNLYSADLTGIDLTGADLTGAFLRFVNFTDANLTGADLTGIDGTGVIWSNTTCPNGVVQSTQCPLTAAG